MKVFQAAILVCVCVAVKIFAQGSAPSTPAASPVPLPEPLAEAQKTNDKFTAPPLKNLRYDEDFSYLRNESKRIDPLDRLKFISLNREKNWFLTIGGEVRLRYETYRNNNFGAGVQDQNGFSTQRFMIHTDFHFGKKLRFFAQIKSGLIENRNGGARLTDLDKLDVHQAFADLTALKNEKITLAVRFGRQEVEFGSSRLVAVREGPNVRQSFDGLRLFLNIGKWQFSPWFLKPVTTRRGIFDDRTNNEQTFWGSYAARNIDGKFKGIAVVYFNQLDTKSARYEQGAGRERRETLGARIAGKTGAFDFNYEIVGQFGKFANVPIQAWAIISDSGYTLLKIRFKPRLAARFDATSGDKNPRDGQLQTFNPLFASPTAYSGLVSLIAPSNSTALIPSLELNLSRRVIIRFDNALFWRTSNRDALYGTAGSVRGGTLSESRFIGSQPSAQFVWRINRYLSATTVYTHFFSGKFLRQTPPAEDVDYLTSYLTFKF